MTVMQKMKKMVEKVAGDDFYASIPRWTTKRDQYTDEVYKGYDLTEIANYLNKKQFATMVQEGFEILEPEVWFNISGELNSEMIRISQVDIIRINQKYRSHYLDGVRWNIKIRGNKSEYMLTGNFEIEFRNIAGRCRSVIRMTYHNDKLGADFESTSAFNMQKQLIEFVEKMEGQAKALEVLKVKYKATAVKPRTKKKVQDHVMTLDDLEKACE